jgi:hypothetical protein
VRRHTTSPWPGCRLSARIVTTGRVGRTRAGARVRSLPIHLRRENLIRRNPAGEWVGACGSRRAHLPGVACTSLPHFRRSRDRAGVPLSFAERVGDVGPLILRRCHRAGWLGVTYCAITFSTSLLPHGLPPRAQGRLIAVCRRSRRARRSLGPPTDPRYWPRVRTTSASCEWRSRGGYVRGCVRLITWW